MVRHVYAVDVSPTITGGGDAPRNLEVVISDGSNIPLPDASVDIAYSHQLIEHMHPDDALAHLREVSRVLKPGGRYICVTPNRWTGPHDISKFFRSVARGLHLREYSATDLLGIFQWLGWTRVTAEMCVKGVYFEVPAGVAVIAEMCFAALPEKARRRLAHISVLNGMLGVVMIGRKPTRDEAEGL
jgi:SAM-dependent methyltransferase